MIIDSHQHAFWHGRDDAGLVADMDEQGIDVAWLLSWEVAPFDDEPRYHPVLNPVHRRGDGTHPGIPLDDLLVARNRFPDRFIVGYCPHPALSDAPALLQAAHEMHGVRVCGEWKFRMLIDDPRCLNLFHKAGELSMPVVLHLDIPYMPDGNGGWKYAAYWYGGTVANLARAMEACPDTIFIGHAPGFWREISGDADERPEMYPQGPVTPGGRLYELFDGHLNLRADLSAGSARIALSRDPQHARSFIERYAGRLLFARDYYGGELHEFLSGLDLSEDIRSKLYSENALGLVAVD